MSFSDIDVEAELASAKEEKLKASDSPAPLETGAPGGAAAPRVPSTRLPGNLATAVVVFDEEDLGASPRQRMQNARKRLVTVLAMNKKVALANKLPQNQQLEHSTAGVALALQVGIGKSLTMAMAEERRSISAAIGAVANAMRTSLRLSHSDDATHGSSVVAVDKDIFEGIRGTLGITNQNFFASLCLQEGASRQHSTFAFTESAGKSNAFFFVSPDHHYILKTTTAAELRTLRRILPSYAAHLRENSIDGASLLPRYCAIFSLERPLRPPLHFVVMTNAFAAANEIHERFDLKGSTVNRWASDSEKAKGARATLKDSDWSAAGRRLATAPLPPPPTPTDTNKVPSVKTFASAAADPGDDRLVTGRRGYNRCGREALARIVARDTAFLRRRNIFDYRSRAIVYGSVARLGTSSPPVPCTQLARRHTSARRGAGGTHRGRAWAGAPRPFHRPSLSQLTHRDLRRWPVTGGTRGRGRAAVHLHHRRARRVRVCATRRMRASSGLDTAVAQPRS